ncbi:hypothetical protein Tco_0223804 [Tanacetum coccineum]
MVFIALVKRKASTSLVGTSEASQPNRKRRLKKKASESGSSTPTVEQAKDVEDVDLSETDYCGFLKDNLKRDEGNSSRAASVPNLRFGKRLGSPPPRFSHDVLSDPSHAGTSNAPSSNHADVRRGIVPTGAAGKARAKEKVKRKVVQLTELRYEFSNMEEKYEKVQKGCHALDHENEDLRSFRDASSDEVKRLMDHLAIVEATAARYQLYPLQH